MVFNNIVGLDIGSSHVRFAECVPDKKTQTFRITKAGEIALPEGVVVGGEVEDVDELGEAIRMLWKENKFTRSRVVTGITGDNTLIREIELPWEKPDLFRSSLPLRLSSDLPVNPFEVEMDYYPIKEVEKKNVLYQQALLVGALKKAVLKTEVSTKIARITLKKVDYVPYALLRAVQMGERLENPEKYLQNKNSKDKTQKEDSEENSEETFETFNEEQDDPYGEVIINMGSQITEVVVHKGDLPLFARTSLVGSAAITKAVAEKLNITEEEAETLKETLGLEESKDPEKLKELLAEKRIAPNTVPLARKIITLMAQALVQNVRETVEYYLDTTNDIEGVKKVRVSGGGILLPGYVERLAGELQTDVIQYNPLELFGDKKVAELTRYLNGVEYVTAYGLAVTA